MKNPVLRLLVVGALALALPLGAAAEAPAAQSPVAQTTAASAAALIRKNLGARVPGLDHIDEIRPTPMAGLYEVRVGNNLLYTDAKGDFLIEGSLIDTRLRRDLTQERVDQLGAIAFKDLPLQNAIPVVYGKGTRKMAAFEDPNCPYCKRLDKEMTQLDDVTIYTFLIPILGPDSVTKAHQIWCNKDRSGSWTGWMLDGKAPSGAGDCDTSALQANLALAQKLNITATPTLFFADGKRVVGAVPLDKIEPLLGRK